MKKCEKIVMYAAMSMFLFACGKEKNVDEEAVTLITSPTNPIVENQSTVQNDLTQGGTNEIIENITIQETVETITENGTEVTISAIIQPVTEVTQPVTEVTQQLSTEPESKMVVTETLQLVTEATQPVTEATQPVTEATQPVTEATQPVPTEPVTEVVTTELVTEATQPVGQDGSAVEATQAQVPVEQVPTEQVQTEPATEGGALTEFELRVVNDVWVYSAFIQKAIGLANTERRNQGLPMLQYDVNLAKVATHRCIENIDNDIFSHTRPDGSPCFTLYPVYGIAYEAAAENIAAGQVTPEEVIDAWMNSPMHRDNILGNYTYVGVGISSDASGCLFWAMCFRR